MNQETWKIRLAFALVLFFFVSVFFAFRELQYLIWGKTTEAQLIEVYQGQEGGRRSAPALIFHYAFPDPEGNLPMRDENDFLPLDTPRPSGNTVRVQYLSGTKYASRLEGHRKMEYVVFLAIAMLAAAGFVGKLALEANEPVKKPSSGQRRR
jgi:hypothetical protein